MTQVAETPNTASLSNEELAEIQELFPELPDQELRRFIAALDCTIDKIFDSYFGLNPEHNQLVGVK